MKDAIQDKRIHGWISGCRPGAALHLGEARNVRSGDEREVWKIRFTVDGVDTSAVLIVFKPGDLQSVNTSLPPAQAAEKCALAMTELPSFGIPTPALLGQAKDGAESALLCERLDRTDWCPSVRIEAARILARLHGLSESSLSATLRHLVSISDPRESRTTGGQAPIPDSKTLVHGDYFSANILPVTEGLRIIDWETLGWGDPMWDLGFLVGADRNLPDDEVRATIDAYAREATVHAEQLAWHQQRWREFWRKREQ